MALDQSFVGRTYRPPPPTRWAGRRSASSPRPWGRPTRCSRTRKPPSVRVLRRDRPPTFVFSITFRAAGQVIEDPQLGLDYSRVVHGDQKFAYRRPVRAGDRLTVTSTIEAIKSLAGNDILDIRGEVHDEAGEHVVTAWTKLVARAAEEA